MNEKPDPSDIEISEEQLSGDSESTTVIVTDSENYGQTQRLKQIYKAKDMVRQLRRNEEELAKQYNEYWRGTHGREIYNRELASKIAYYGSELLPVIEEARRNGTLTEADMRTQGRFDISVKEFIEKDGMEFDHQNEEVEAYSPLKSLAVYRQLNEILRKLGLGLNFEEEKGPAEI
jgi:hypothetical protein